MTASRSSASKDNFLMATEPTLLPEGPPASGAPRAVDGEPTFLDDDFHVAPDQLPPHVSVTNTRKALGEKEALVPRSAGAKQQES